MSRVLVIARNKKEDAKNFLGKAFAIVVNGCQLAIPKDNLLQAPKNKLHSDGLT